MSFEISCFSFCFIIIFYLFSLRAWISCVFLVPVNVVLLMPSWASPPIIQIALQQWSLSQRFGTLMVNDSYIWILKWHLYDSFLFGVGQISWCFLPEFLVYPDGTVCISILHPPGDDPNGYEHASERWNPVHTVSS